MTNSNRICLLSEPGDSSYFGFSVAINDKYLAVGDPNANRVCIYTRNDNDLWTRSKYILPPINSVPYRIGHGFGKNLKLDDDVLLIGDEVILISSETEQYTKGIVDPREFQFVDSAPVFFSRYFTKLSSEAEPQRLKVYPNTTPGLAKFTVLSEGEIRQIILPDNEEKEFGCSVALHKNLFLVGSPCCYTGGRAWLFELDQPDKKPTKLALPNTYMGNTVAISEQFAAVGDPGPLYSSCLDDAPKLPKRTLIKAINSNATSVIDQLGILSLSKNILAIMRPESLEHCQTSLLKVFHLDQDATPNLILCREHEYLIDASVQNGYLITVEDTHSSGMKIYIESMPQ